jgi:hypothetical protein
LCAILAIAISTAWACFPGLEHVTSCGDGFVDSLAGEECEPGLAIDDDGDWCRDKPAPAAVECDPVSCTVTCRYCGDGIADEDLGEECDAKSGGIVEVEDCANLATSEPGTSYVSGQTYLCTDRCLYSRAHCSFCGDGQIQRTVFVDTQTGDVIPAEECDGPDEEPSPATNEDYFGQLCAPSGGISTENVYLRPHFSCTDGCRLAQPSSGLQCCRPTGVACPSAQEVSPCCYELNHPDEQEFCSEVGISPSGGETRRCL